MAVNSSLTSHATTRPSSGIASASRMVDTLDRLLADGQAETFDLVYIDAEKLEYPDYYERSLALARRGGVIAIDNVLRRGEVADASVQDRPTVVIRAFNERVRDDSRVASTLLPMRDGLTLALKL